VRLLFEGTDRACFVHSASDMKLLLSTRQSLTLIDAIMKRIARRHYLKQSEAWVIAVLGGHEYASAATLAVTLGWARQQVHRTLQELARADLVAWIVRDEGQHPRWQLTELGTTRWKQLQHSLATYEKTLMNHEVDLAGFARSADQMMRVLLNRPQAGWVNGLVAPMEQPLLSGSDCCRCADCTCGCHSEPY